MPTKKVLAAIMFTDITGFSAMMQASETLATQVRNRHRSVFKGYHEKYTGKILQYFGDGTLSIFESVSAAVECAVEMQIEFRKEPEVPLRIGIHTGDITYDEEGAYGNSMNIASRVENLAVPGSIFITSKVYDDIKNHRWLTAIFMGSFKLRNIFHNVDIYAVTSKGMIVPALDQLAIDPELEDEVTVESRQGRGRRKGVAFLLAFLFGVFGVHRFYLGQRGKGIAMLVFSIIAIIATAQEGVPLIAVMGIIAFIDAILLLFMPRLQFDNKYNRDLNRAVPRSKKLQKKARTQRAKPKSRVDPSKKYFDKGVREYKKGRYNEAVDLFDQVLEIRPNDYLAHFYLARIFSLMYDKEDSFFHLEKAVENGFDDYPWLEEDPAFEFLREQVEYPNFRQNKYRRVAELPEPQPDLLENLEKFNPEILDKIEALGDAMERGEITREEFDVEKKKILGSGNN